jgi:hypothetical protein
MAGLELVELRCEDEIAFSEAVDLVRPGGDLRLAPAQQNIRVMALRFRYFAYFIHESERGLEIGKRKRLRNVVFVDDLPSGQRPWGAAPSCHPAPTGSVRVNS